MNVSVVIPTFNRPKKISKTLDALKQQTYPSNQFEVIVVDDGSEVQLDIFADRDDPFFLHCLRQKNSGATVARNFGASKSRGEFLVFMDDDIHLLPDTLEYRAASTACLAPSLARDMRRRVPVRDADAERRHGGIRSMSSSSMLRSLISSCSPAHTRITRTRQERRKRV